MWLISSTANLGWILFPLKTNSSVPETPTPTQMLYDLKPRVLSWSTLLLQQNQYTKKKSFCESDSGGRGVLQNSGSYRTEILRQLSKNHFYTVLFGEKLCLSRGQTERSLRHKFSVDWLSNVCKFNFRCVSFLSVKRLLLTQKILHLLSFMELIIADHLQNARQPCVQSVWMKCNAKLPMRDLKWSKMSLI